MGVQMSRVVCLSATSGALCGRTTCASRGKEEEENGSLLSLLQRVVARVAYASRQGKVQVHMLSNGVLVRITQCQYIQMHDCILLIT